MKPVSNLIALDGQPVRVKPAIADSLNSVGMWGSIRVHQQAAEPGELRVEVVLQFPDTFERAAHAKVVPLNSSQIHALLASPKKEGTYELTLGHPVASDIPS